jgi:hypothetical protein
VGAAGAVQRNVAGSWLTFGVEEETVRVVLAPAEKSGVIVPEADDGCREGADMSESEVREKLLEHSGVPRLRKMVAEHFGNRATLIKLDQALGEVSLAVGRCRRAALQSRRLPASEVSDVAAKVEQLRSNIHSFAELAVLSAVYRGSLSFPPDWVAELLTVTGENGTTCAARLGLSEDAALRVLTRRADERIGVWARRCADDLLDEPIRRAAQTIMASYERLADRIRSARQLLDANGL